MKNGFELIKFCLPNIRLFIEDKTSGMLALTRLHEAGFSEIRFETFINNYRKNGDIEFSRPAAEVFTSAEQQVICIA